METRGIPINRSEMFSLGVILLIAALIRWAGFVGFQPSDPSSYAGLAALLGDGVVPIPGYDGPPVFPLRWGMYVPTAVLVYLFGPSNWVFGAYPFALGLVLCIVAYLFGRALGSSRTGLFAAAAVAVVPCAAITSLWADFAASVWGAAGLLVLLYALRSASTRCAAFQALLAGSIFWVAWIHKESAIMLAPTVLALPMMPVGGADRRRGMIVLICAVAGALALLLGEMATYRVLTGDWLFRFHEVHRNYDLYSEYFFSQSSTMNGWKEGGFWGALLRRWFVHGPASLFANKLLSLLPTLAIASFLICVAIRYLTGGVRLLLLWLISLCLFLNFMTVSFSAYQPLPLAPQYLSWLILPSALMVAMLASRAFESQSGPFMCGCSVPRAVLLMPWVGACAIASYQDFNRIRTQDYLPIERVVAASIAGTELVVTDRNTARNLDFFRFKALLRPSGNCLSWDLLPHVAVPRGALVLLNHEELGYLSQVGYQPPAGWKDPEGWIHVRTFGGKATLYRLPD